MGPVSQFSSFLTLDTDAGILIAVTISDFTGKNYITDREKEHCTIFIRVCFMWGLQLGLGLS